MLDDKKKQFHKGKRGEVIQSLANATPLSQLALCPRGSPCFLVAARLITLLLATR